MIEADKVPGQTEIYNIAAGIKDERDRALFVFEYLSGGRVGEIVRRCKKSQLDVRKIDGVPFLVIEGIYTEKNRRDKERTLPIPINHEQKLLNLAISYIDTLHYDDVMFDFSRSTAWRHISKVVMSFKDKSIKNRHMNANHYLRHCRATHLVTLYSYGAFELMQFFGWSDTRPAGRYTHLMVTHLAKKMM